MSESPKIEVKSSHDYFWPALILAVLLFTGKEPTIFESLRLIFAHWAGTP